MQKITSLSIVDLRSPGNLKTRQGELHRNYVVLVSSSNRGMSCMIGNVLSVLLILLEMYLVTFPR